MRVRSAILTALLCATDLPAQTYTVEPGTRIPLALINSVSTKTAVPGDRVYLETVYPIVSDNRILIPPGSYVNGTVTKSTRPGRVKGRGELYVRFDSITLPNGVVREFRSRLGAIDGQQGGELDKNEGIVKGDSHVGGDLKTIAETGAAGASIGAVTGAAKGTGGGIQQSVSRIGSGSGAAIGAGLGAAAGLIGILVTRGPEAVLAKGSTVEMVLDRRLSFSADDVAFEPARPSK